MGGAASVCIGASSGTSSREYETTRTRTRTSST